MEKDACVYIYGKEEERFPLSDPWFSRFYGSFRAFVLRLDRRDWLERNFIFDRWYSRVKYTPRVI